MDNWPKAGTYGNQGWPPPFAKVYACHNLYAGQLAGTILEKICDKWRDDEESREWKLWWIPLEKVPVWCWIIERQVSGEDIKKAGKIFSPPAVFWVPFAAWSEHAFIIFVQIVLRSICVSALFGMEAGKGYRFPFWSGVGGGSVSCCL